MLRRGAEDNGAQAARRVVASAVGVLHVPSCCFRVCPALSSAQPSFRERRGADTWTRTRLGFGVCCKRVGGEAAAERRVVLVAKAQRRAAFPGGKHARRGAPPRAVEEEAWRVGLSAGTEGMGREWRALESAARRRASWRGCSAQAATKGVFTAAQQVGITFLHFYKTVVRAGVTPICAA